MPNGSKHNADATILLALASGKTAGEAAILASVSESTVWRRMRVDWFKRRLQRLKHHLFSQATAKAANLLAGSIDTIDALRNSADERVRLAAARSLVEIAARLWEKSELNDKVEELAGELAKLKAENPALFQGIDNGG